MSKSLVHTEILNTYSKKENWRVYIILLVEWSVIFSIFFASIHLNNLFVYTIGAFIIATRIYAFYSLTHEACHYHLHNNKRINDIIGNLFLAWPIFTSIQEMRRIHFLHHKHLQSKDDPEMKHLKYEEFIFPLSKKALFIILLKDITGINFIQYRIKKPVNLPLLHSINKYKIIYYLSILAIFASSGYFISCILLWIIPYMTVFQLLNRVRLYYEHFNMLPQRKYKTRTLHLSRPSAVFLAPYGLGYHAEHHLFPGVPFYHLRKIHIILSTHEDYINGLEIEKNYLLMLRKFLKNDRP